jgi:hypothetical protein
MLSIEMFGYNSPGGQNGRGIGMQIDQRSTKYVSNAPQIFHSAFGFGREIQDQCDLACISRFSHTKQLAITSTNILYSANLFDAIPLTAHFYTVLATQAPFPIVLNGSAFTLANYFTSPRFLTDIPPAWRNTWGQLTIQTTLTQMVNLGLLRPANQPALTPVEQPTILSAWLHLTDRCNLRCAYCYLPHRRVRGHQRHHPLGAQARLPAGQAQVRRRRAAAPLFHHYRPASPRPNARRKAPSNPPRHHSQQRDVAHTRNRPNDENLRYPPDDFHGRPGRIPRPAARLPRWTGVVC